MSRSISDFSGRDSNPHKPAIVYRYQEGLYVNLTNRCPTSCSFCIKTRWSMGYRGYDLLLPREPGVAEVLQALEEAGPCGEVVFCGYGEPTYRLSDLLEIAVALKRKNNRNKGYRGIRLNTIGLGNLIHGRDIVPDMVDCIDAVSISLNSAESDQWVKLHRPRSQYRKGGFTSVLDFIRRCAELLPETVVTAVDLPGVDVARCRSVAEILGARFRLRPTLQGMPQGSG